MASHTCGLWHTTQCKRWQQHRHFSTDMTEIEFPFQSKCLSCGDRDQSKELEDGWSIGGDGTAAGGRWKSECPVVRQVAERSDAIGPGGVCSAQLRPTARALHTAASLRKG